MKYNIDHTQDFIQYLSQNYGWVYNKQEGCLSKEDALISIKRWMIQGPNDRGLTLQLLVRCCPGKDPNKVFKRIKQYIQVRQEWRNAEFRMAEEQQRAAHLEDEIQRIWTQYGVQVRAYRPLKNQKVVIDLVDLYRLIGGC